MEAVVQPRPGISWPRAVLVGLLAWWTLRLITASTWIFLDFVNLAFHEAGHLVFSFLGATMHFLGGTLGQLLVPGLLMIHFLFRQQQPLGAAFCLWWFGQNFINISVYMADARALRTCAVSRRCCSASAGASISCYPPRGESVYEMA